ncbi:MAG: DUF1330 domain-containing protein [Myxococcota bacterium]
MLYVDPTREGFGAFAKAPLNGPLHMLNLLRLKEKATYEDGREATGREAYAAYGRESAPFFQKQGGTIMWRGKPFFPLIGPSTETWDLGFIAAYPSKEAFLGMVKDPGYQAIVYHRQAAVETSRLYAFAAVEGSGVFG